MKKQQEIIGKLSTRLEAKEIKDKEKMDVDTKDETIGTMDIVLTPNLHFPKMLHQETIAKINPF